MQQAAARVHPARFCKAAPRSAARRARDPRGGDAEEDGLGDSLRLLRLLQNAFGYKNYKV
jgi:hypothetical protein